MKTARALPLLPALLLLLEALAVLALTPCCPHTIQCPAGSGPKWDPSELISPRV